MLINILSSKREQNKKFINTEVLRADPEERIGKTYLMINYVNSRKQRLPVLGLLQTH